MLPLFEAIKTLAKQANAKLDLASKRHHLSFSLPREIWIPVIISIIVSSVVGFSAAIISLALIENISVSEVIFRVFNAIGRGRDHIGDIELITPQQEIIRERTVIEREKEYVPQTSEEERVIRVVRVISPSVVSIVISKDVPVLEQYFVNPFEEFEQFFGNDFPTPFQFQVPQFRQKGTQKQQVGGGTGFIITRDGLIVTNKHVVQDTQAEYTVFTNKGEKYQAQVLGRDPLKDLAVLKISASNLSPVVLGDSNHLEMGQTVIAVGNALGEFRNTVSLGVISGLNRAIVADGQRIENVIQTDAAINRGNSGGPLVNLRGEVIGINTAMIIGAQNIGFAIPINDAKRMIGEVEKSGKLSYPFLGVRYVLVTPDLKEQYKLPVDYGAWVVRGTRTDDVAVVSGSPAEKAGIQENDIILEVNGQKITRDNTLAKMILAQQVGSTITLKILRKGNEVILQATLQELR